MTAARRSVVGGVDVVEHDRHAHRRDLVANRLGIGPRVPRRSRWTPTIA